MSNLLEQYRQKDEKTPQGEVLPQNETLNGERIAEYLKTNGFHSVENFDERFSMQTVYDVLSLGNTQGEKEMLAIIKSAQSFLESIGREKLMIESPTRAAFASTINKELLRRNQLDEEADLLKAYEAFATVRDVMRNRLVLHEQFAEQREDEKEGIGESMKETFAGIYKEVKKNFKGMSSGEKLMTVGALVIGGGWFVMSDNEHVKKIKETLWSGLKLAGGVGAGAVGVNYLWKLFTGKTALTAFDEWTESTAGNAEFWEKTFETDAEKAETLRKGIVYLGDMDFLTLAKKYKDAKRNNETSINLVTVDKSDMTPEEVYTALDTFFGKYPVEKLELRYRKSETSPEFSNVVTTMLAEDGRLEYEGNVYERTVQTIDDWRTRGWNWLVTGAGLESGRWLYLKVRGKEGTDAEVKDWMEQELKPHLDNAVGSESELVDYSERKFRDYPGFKDCINSGVTETGHPSVKFHEVPGDAIYLVTSVNMNVDRGNERMVAHMLQNSIEDSDKFLKARYPQIAQDITKYRDIKGGCRVVDNSTFKLFVRMPVPGSPEFSRRSVMTPEQREDEKSVELFKPTDVISYSAMPNWQAEKLRLHFMIDGSNNADLERICKRFTDEYKNRSMPREEVMRRLFEDNAERDQTLKELGITPDLTAKFNLMKTYNDRLSEIERDASSKVDSTVLRSIGRAILPDSWLETPGNPYDQLAEGMKREMGYKIRLAIMGDSVALREIIAKNPDRYDPGRESDWLENVIDDYEDMCEDFVERFKKGDV